MVGINQVWDPVQGKDLFIYLTIPWRLVDHIYICFCVGLALPLSLYTSMYLLIQTEISLIYANRAQSHIQMPKVSRDNAGDSD